MSTLDVDVMAFERADPDGFSAFWPDALGHDEAAVTRRRDLSRVRDRPP